MLKKIISLLKPQKSEKGTPQNAAKDNDWVKAQRKKLKLPEHNHQTNALNKYSDLVAKILSVQNEKRLEDLINNHSDEELRRLIVQLEREFYNHIVVDDVVADMDGRIRYIIEDNKYTLLRNFKTYKESCAVSVATIENKMLDRSILNKHSMPFITHAIYKKINDEVKIGDKIATIFILDFKDWLTWVEVFNAIQTMKNALGKPRQPKSFESTNDFVARRQKVLNQPITKSKSEQPREYQASIVATRNLQELARRKREEETKQEAARKQKEEAERQARLLAEAEEKRRREQAKLAREERERLEKIERENKGKEELRKKILGL